MCVTEQGQTRSSRLRGLLSVVAAGIVLGALAKAADQSTVPGLGDIGTHLGWWVVVVTVAAVSSPSRSAAALRASLLMIAMVVAYYGATYLYFRLIPPFDIALWGLMAVTAVPVLAALVWPSRETSWSAAAACALPIGLLAAEAFSFRFHPQLRAAPLAFDLIAIAVLMWMLPPDTVTRLRVAVLAIPIAVVGYWVMSVGLGYGAGLLARFMN